MPPLQPDRRPAIWPWLVMPLIALTAFYCLDRLAREARDQEDLAPAPAAAARADAPADVRAEAGTAVADAAAPVEAGTAVADAPADARAEPDRDSRRPG
jgi:hypothetical protein